MDYFRAALVQPQQKQPVGEPTGVSLGLENGLPDSLYKLQRSLLVYHDRVEQQVAIYMQEFSQKRTDTNLLEKLSSTDNTIKATLEHDIPNAERTIKDNQPQILSGLQSSIEKIQIIQKAEEERKREHDAILEKTKQQMVTDRETFKKDFVTVEAKKINEWFERKQVEIKAKYTYPVPTQEKPVETKVEETPAPVEEQTPTEESKPEESKPEEVVITETTTEEQPKETET